MEPAPGVKGSQISNLDKDIARGLSVKSVRVVDVIPGKSVIGMEIPNAHREMIYLSEILRSKEYDKVRRRWH
jgi:S-DNA-T family DNA segregation ATPase FtsK/SpoIIIE